jgi:hypothetical protein
MAHYCDAAQASNNSLQVSQPEQAPLIRGGPNEGTFDDPGHHIHSCDLTSEFAGNPARKTDKTLGA